MLQRLELHNFKAFERFTVNLKPMTFLAGPNNAGKSTIIAALRACAYMLRQAQRRRPVDVITDRGNEVMCFYFNSDQVALVDENLPHEFRDVESRVVLHFAGQKRLTAVWPAGSLDTSPYFFLQIAGNSVLTSREAIDEFPLIGIVPILSPVDQREAMLTPKYVRENIDGRLASRHFRNQLLLLQENSRGDDFGAYVAFAQPWVPEIRIRDLAMHRRENQSELDLYYTEPGRRADKEIVWAGDGIQIWLQLLLHLFRLQAADAVILDEPDVFLHPDLQRRTVKVLESLEAQTITATHSSEVLVEAPQEAVVWVDRARKRSISTPDSVALAELSSSLGTQFNIRLARALRSKTVVFVEGDDMKLLRHAASAIGADKIAKEAEVTVIPLRGFSNWDRIEPFKWLMDDLLEESVTAFAILDRDYRPEAACAAVKTRLRSVGVKAHVWRRKELESYFLDVAPLARVCGATTKWLHTQLAEIASAMEAQVFAIFASERQKLEPRDHQVQALRAAKREFDAAWADESGRLWLCPAGEVLSQLNQRLTAAGHRFASFRAIAHAMTDPDIPHEMRRLLERIEESTQQSA